MALNARFAMTPPEVPISVSNQIQKDWYLFLVNIYNAVTQGLPQPEVALTVGASPFSYQAVIRGQVFINGGTVSAIEYSRDGTTFYSTGLTAGVVQMDARDIVRVTYSAPPALTFFAM